MNIEFIFIAIVVIGIALFLLRHKAKALKFKKRAKLEVKKAGPAPIIQIRPEIPQEPVSPPIPLAVPPVTVISFTDRLKKGLSRSRQEVWGKLSTLFSGGLSILDEDKIESLEELLYGADIGTATVAELMVEVHKKAKEGNLSEESFKNFLFDFLKAKMEPIQSKVDHGLYQFNPSDKKLTKVIMVVGVNGAGKTTTIGKLATKLRAQGANVVVGACDTFRAAAVDQLQVWCDRAGATMIRAKEGSNPSGVGYDALQAAINQNADYCILDTAGRLHTKENLMDELVKSKNVLKKLDPSAPHQILLVIDAITGQNALRQAEEFHKALDLTGLIFTKCDGSSKAGSAVSIVEQLKIPIAYIGVGETAEDLDVFRIDDYLKALLGI
ncbi:MAG: signal recognition particle-docking protein FtsY [Bacteriovorax sp.]|nr:signal recognition particle-docking protein FtsY [Bacteriovorax sp.]